MAEQQRVFRRAALQVGATRMKGGLGSASRPFGTAGVVGAIAVTNSLGNIVARDAATYLQENPQVSHAGNLTTATTLVVVATNAALDKTQCGKEARMAQAGLARAVHPAFTSMDGDVVLVRANGSEDASVDAVGVIVAEAVADAICDSVRQATSRGDVPDMHTPGRATSATRRGRRHKRRPSGSNWETIGMRTSRKYCTIPLDRVCIC